MTNLSPFRTINLQSPRYVLSEYQLRQPTDVISFNDETQIATASYGLNYQDTIQVIKSLKATGAKLILVSGLWTLHQKPPGIKQNFNTLIFEDESMLINLDRNTLLSELDRYANALQARVSKLNLYWRVDLTERESND